VVFGPQTAKDAVDPPQFLWPVASSVGECREGNRGCRGQHRANLHDVDRHHNQMEPHATTRSGRRRTPPSMKHPSTSSAPKELVSIVLGIHRRRSTSCPISWAAARGKAYVWPHTLLAGWPRRC